MSIEREQKGGHTSGVGAARRSPRYSDHNTGILCAPSFQKGTLGVTLRNGEMIRAICARKSSEAADGW